MTEEEREERADAFLDAVLDKGTVWLLWGVGVLAVVVAVVQVGRWFA